SSTAARGGRLGRTVRHEGSVVGDGRQRWSGEIGEKAMGVSRNAPPTLIVLLEYTLDIGGAVGWRFDHFSKRVLGHSAVGILLAHVGTLHLVEDGLDRDAQLH